MTLNSGVQGIYVSSCRRDQEDTNKVGADSEGSNGSEDLAMTPHNNGHIPGSSRDRSKSPEWDAGNNYKWYMLVDNNANAQGNKEWMTRPLYESVMHAAKEGTNMMYKPARLKDSVGGLREPATKGVAADWILSFVSSNIGGTKDANILEMTSKSNDKQSRMTTLLSSTEAECMALTLMEAGCMKGDNHSLQGKEQWLGNVDNKGRQVKSPLQDVREDYCDTYKSSEMNSIHLESCKESIMNIQNGQILTMRENEFGTNQSNHSQRTRARTVRQKGLVPIQMAPQECVGMS